MFKLANAAEFDRGLESWLKETKEELDDVFRGYCVALFHTVALNTPQWSGNAASNWNLSVGSPDYTVTFDLLEEERDRPFPDRMMGPLYQVGHPRAVERAVERNRGGDQAIKTFQSVFISNASESLDGKVYIEMLETNPNEYLRDENEGGGMVAKTVAKSMLAFPTLSAFQAGVLRRLRLGQFDNGGLM